MAERVRAGFLSAVIFGFLVTTFMPSPATAQYKDYTRELFEQQKRIQQQQQRQRYVPRNNTSRQRTNTNNLEYLRRLQRRQQLQQQQRQRQRNAAPATRTMRTQPAAPRQKPAGFDAKAAAEQWRQRRQQQNSRRGVRSTGKPTGITTNRARSAGRGATTGVTRRSGGGIEGEGVNDIRMRGVVGRKPTTSGQRYCGCRGADVLVYGAICYPAKGKSYKVGNFPWTPQCSQDAFRRATSNNGRR